MSKKAYFRLPLVFAAVLSLVYSTLAFAQSDGSVQLEQELKHILKEKNTVVALAKLDAIKSKSGLVPRKVYLESLLSAYHDSKNPSLRFSLYRSIAWTYRELHDLTLGYGGEKGLGAKQGCLRHFGMVGPFDNPSMESFDKAFGPELGELGPYSGRFETVDWRETPAFDYRCVVSLNNFIQPSTSALTYLSSSVKASKATQALFLFGSSSAYKIWVNGVLVGKNKDDFGLLIDSDAWEFRLKKGENSILIKLASTQEGGFVFTSRLVDKKSMRPLSFSNTSMLKSVKTRDGKIKPDSRGIRKQIIKTAAGQGDNATWAISYWKEELSRDAATPWRAEADRLLKNKKNLSTRALLNLSEAYEEYWKQRDILEEAHRKGKVEDAVFRLSRLYSEGLSVVDRRKSKEVLENNKSNSLGSVLALVGWEIENGSKQKAKALLAPLWDLKIPTVLFYKASILSSLGTRVDHEGIQKEIYSQSFKPVWSRTNSFIKDGKFDEALSLLRSYRKWTPNSQYAAKREARLMERMGKKEEALKILNQWIKWSPGEEDLYNAKAGLLLRMDRKDEAVQALKRILVFHSQEQKIRRRLAFLTPQESSFYVNWLVDDVRKKASEMKKSQFSTDTIIDQSVTKVSRNGLSSKFVQHVVRINTKEGIESAKYQRAYYQGGEEDAQVVKISVYKKDGSMSENSDSWDSGGTRKQATTYNDSATLTMQANDVEIGDLVEFRYLVTQISGENFRGDYFGDVAYLQSSTPIGFQRYAVIYPKSWKLFFRKPKIPHTRYDNKLPDGADDIPKGFQTTSFDFKDVKEVISDNSQPGYSEVYDYLLVSNKETYDEIGAWWWDLVEEQLIADEEIKKKVAEVTKGLKKEKEKMQAIHNYVVRNTRYLHVGLGIHGWKPYRTTTCFRNRYGDCKDKASLLKVMLEVAGIPANLVLVRTRSLGDLESYPASMHIFNHAITYVPKFDLFLDGTAEYNGTTELTSMDQGARGLIIQDGGKARWVKLPIDKAKANLVTHDMFVEIEGKKSRVRGVLVAKGTNAVYYRHTLEDAERRDEILEKQLSSLYSGATLVSAKYKNLSNLEKPVVIEYVIEGGRLLLSDGTRDFILPMGRQKNLLDAYARQPKRNQPLTISTPFANHTKVHYHLSKASIKLLPEDFELRSRFGSVKIVYKKQKQGLIADVEYSLDLQRISVDDYKDFRAFLRDATRALNTSIEVGKE